MRIKKKEEDAYLLKSKVKLSLRRWASSLHISDASWTQGRATAHRQHLTWD